MPVYVLNPGGEVKLLRQPVRCVVMLPREAGGAARVTALSGGTVAQHVIQERAESVVIPTVDAEITIQVAPPAGFESFPAGSIAQLSLLGMGQSADPERLNLTSTDLSGLGAVELVRLSPAEHHLTVRPAAVSKLQQLTPLGDAARMITAELLGTNSIADEHATAFAVALDTSASFRRCVDSGAARAAVDILSGVASILGEREQLTFLMPNQRPVVADDLATAGQQVEQLIAAQPLGTLFETAHLTESITSLSPATRITAFVLSDSVPSDYSQQAQQVADRASLVPLVLGPAQLISRLTSASVTPIIIDTGDGSFTVEHTYLQHLPALRAVVEAIIRSTHPVRSH